MKLGFLPARQLHFTEKSTVRPEKQVKHYGFHRMVRRIEVEYYGMSDLSVGKLFKNPRK